MKKRLVIVFVVLFLALCLGRFIWFNEKYPDVTRMYYGQGEFVPLEKDVVYIDQMDGYEVRVNGAQVMYLEDFFQKYSVTEEQKAELYEGYMVPPEALYDITITLKNVDNTETGISFADWVIQSDDIWCDFHDVLYRIANPGVDTSHVALRTGSEMEFHLIYNLREERFLPEVWQNIQNYPMWITITCYPVKKMIDLN